jgi:bifunctional UDP-N-acetylglucosamine pyrophosphorylase/glucosamine-1-phosphate N-acetyltransferase
MGELTENCPKPMLTIHGKPKLAYSIETLPLVVTDVIGVVGYLKEQIVEYFGDVYEGRRMHYVTQEVFNGTAGAMNLCKNTIEGSRFLVTMGDDLYLRSDLEMLLQYDQALLAYKTYEAQQFGLVDVDDNGFLRGVIERPHDKKEGLINTGAYVLSREYFDVDMVRISEAEYGLPQTLAAMNPGHKTKIVEAKQWMAIGTPDDLQRAQEDIYTFIV